MKIFISVLDHEERKGMCGAHILHDAFPLDDETCFLFYLVKFWFLEKDLKSSLIFVLFLKGKTKMKEKKL